MYCFCSNKTNFSRNNKTILNDISLSIFNGEVLCLLGANGSGKSTFLSILAGELEARGAVTINGHALEKIGVKQQACYRAVVPQKPSLEFDLEVSEVVAMGAYPFPNLKKNEIDILCNEAMDKAKIDFLSKRRYMELSGGEQQRVHYARAILQLLGGLHSRKESSYLLLDEPTSSLDPLHQHTLLNSVNELSKNHNIGVLTVLHDVNLAALYSDRIALLSQGEILSYGTPFEVLTPDNLDKVYGISAHVMTHPKCNKPLVIFG